MNKRVWPFLYAHTHFLFSWLSSGDVVLSFFLLSLNFLAGTVCFQLFVHKVFKRVQVSFSFVLIRLQMENGGEPSAFGRLWSNKAGKKPRNGSPNRMQEDLPSGHCGKRVMWDIPVHRSQSTPHNAEYSPPESNKDVCFETQIYLRVCWMTKQGSERFVTWPTSCSLITVLF